MKKGVYILFLLFSCSVFSQENKVEFRTLPIEALPLPPDFHFYKIECTRSGALFLNSSIGIITYQGLRINFPPAPMLADEKIEIRKIRQYHAEDSIKLMCSGPGSMLFFVSKDNNLLLVSKGFLTKMGWSNPPLNVLFYEKNKPAISCIWIDKNGNLLVGTRLNGLYIIKGASNLSPEEGTLDSAGNFEYRVAIKRIKKIPVPSGIEITTFGQQQQKNEIVWMGTNKGLASYNTTTGDFKFFNTHLSENVTVTDLEVRNTDDVWFTTIEKGLGVLQTSSNQYRFFPPYLGNNFGKHNSICAFCRKSEGEFFVACTDSSPAIFNIKKGNYSFLQDTSLQKAGDGVTDIKIDAMGNLFTIKGGRLFFTKSFEECKKFASQQLDSSAYAPFIYEFKINGKNYLEVAKTADDLPDLKEIRLKFNQNQLEFAYSLVEFWDRKNVEMNWTLDGLNMGWVNYPSTNPNEKNRAKLVAPLKPGRYVFRIRARLNKENWRNQEAHVSIIITPPFWQTWPFWCICGVVLIVILLFFYRHHIRSVRNKERKKIEHEKELLELEAKALRAQMNPHFIYNCMNSIKALMQKNDVDKGVSYLTTFSKLIRTLFQNSDKRQITLHDEIETCKLYMQLEAMRLEGKLKHNFNIDSNLDLKSVMVPALIIQPFIENAIWHGIVPKDGGTISIAVKRHEDKIVCEVDDDGIGRDMSKRNKPATVIHESKGVHLSQQRLNLEKMLNDTNASIEIIDKHENGIPTGTKVILNFNLS